MANFGQLKMANNERTEKERSCKRHMLCSIFANLTIVLLLNYIMTSLQEKYIISKNGHIYNIELSHWYKVDKVFYTPEAKLKCVKITSYITKRS